MNRQRQWQRVSVERLHNFLDRYNIHWTVWAAAAGLIATFAANSSDGIGSVVSWVVPAAVVVGLAGTFLLRSWMQRRALSSIGFDDWHHSVMPWGPQIDPGVLPADPSPLIRFALVSPLTGAVTGVALFLLGWLLGGPSSVAAALLWWLGVASVLLSMVDLLPAIPCSGRYLAWTVGWLRSGESLGGRRFADWSGLGVSIALGVGALATLKGSPIVGVTLGLLSYFLGQGAMADLRATRVEARQRLLRRVMGQTGFGRFGPTGQPSSPRANDRLNRQGAAAEGGSARNARSWGRPGSGSASTDRSEPAASSARSSSTGAGQSASSQSASGQAGSGQSASGQSSAGSSAPRRHVDIIDVEIIRE